MGEEEVKGNKWDNNHHHYNNHQHHGSNDDMGNVLEMMKELLPHPLITLPVKYNAFQLTERNEESLYSRFRDVEQLIQKGLVDKEKESRERAQTDFFSSFNLSHYLKKTTLRRKSATTSQVKRENNAQYNTVKAPRKRPTSTLHSSHFGGLVDPSFFRFCPSFFNFS